MCKDNHILIAANHYALKIPLNAGNDLDYNSILSIAGMKSLEFREYEQSLLLLYKCIKENAPTYISDFFKFRVYYYDLRGGGCFLVQPFYNNQYFHNSFTFMITQTEFREKLSTLSSSLKLSIDNVAIEHVSSVKSLGIFIDENLRWQTHIDKLSKKVASGIRAIKRIRPFVPPPTHQYIYNARIQSHFDYCNPVWGNCGKTLFDRLQKLQTRAARVLTFSSYDADANRLIRQLDWKDLSTQFQIQKALMVYKSLNGLASEYLSSKFVKRNETRYSLTDSVNKLSVPFPRPNFMKNSFSYSRAVLWNSLPCNVREATG